jgi:hypothetical protein
MDSADCIKTSPRQILIFFTHQSLAGDARGRSGKGSPRKT